MSKETLDHARANIAQVAARLMVEDGISDYAYAKKKAAREVGFHDNSMLPTNAEVEAEIIIYHQLFSEDQPRDLLILRQAALATMQLFKPFNPHLTGTVLDGTAGKNSRTDIHLFADSAKEIEIFLLNQQIPFESSEKSYRISDKPSKDKKSKARKTVPIYTLETEYGLQVLSVFEFDDMRYATKRTADGSNANRADITELQAMINASVADDTNPA